MSNTSTLKKSRRPGRPMTIGRIICGTDIPGGLGVFVGLCPDNHKVVLTISEADKLAHKYIKEHKRWSVRALEHLMKLRAI